jgi:hypothetical protein
MVRTKIHDLVNAGDDDELEAFFEEDQDHKKLVNEVCPSLRAARDPAFDVYSNPSQ